MPYLQSNEQRAERRAQILKMRKAGKKYQEIANALGITSGTVGHYLPRELKPNRKELAASSKPPRAVASKPRGVVSVLGGAANHVRHHDWFAAGYLQAYADRYGLDLKELVKDIREIVNA